MIPFRTCFARIQVILVLFASFALAALQNVTVDDSVLTGAVVPQYLPAGSVWNQGNNCTGCFVKPDPSRAYNGTWHDSTYSPSNSYTQAIEFTFTGSALYIFFIIANNVTGATTFTNVQFTLDGVTAGTYVHTPSTSTDYEYNVPVYANNLLSLGQHQMTIQPVNTGNNILILFDYLIYTMDTSSSSSVSSSGTGTATSPPSVASSPTTSATSGAGTSSVAPNVGAIVGGTVGGIAVLVIVAVFLLCHRRHKRRNDVQPSAEEGTVVDPFILSREVDPTPLIDTTSSTLFVTEAASRGKTGVSSVAAIVPRQPDPPASTTGSGSSSGGAVSSNGNRELIEQVGLLRDELARIRHLHDSNRNTVVSQTEAPPEYSEG